MPTARHWLILPALTTVALLAIPTQRSLGQNPAQTPFNPYATFTSVTPAPYWGYSGYPWSISPAADIIRAQGQLLLDVQQAYLMREQVKQLKFETRRKQLEQWLWERENLPTTEDERQRLQRENLRRSRNDPPMTEIWSAKALNDILLDYQKTPSLLSAANEAIPEGLLAQINVTTGKYEANIGILKQKPHWPLILHRDAFRASRTQIESLLDRAVKKAQVEEMDAAALEELNLRLRELEQKLTGMLRSQGNDATFTPTMYIDAKTFLAQLKNALLLMQQPDASKYFSGKYAVKGRTVGDVIRHMAENGLRFAAASPGNQAAYTALHRALVSADSRDDAPAKGNKN